MPATAKKSLTKATKKKATVATPLGRGDTRARRSETIKFLTLDETRRLFSRALVQTRYMDGRVPN